VVAHNGKKGKIRWYKSKAKLKLKEDIIAGTVTDESDPKDVYGMHPKFKDFEFKDFKTSLANLIEAIQKDYTRMRDDCEYYGHDLAIIKELRQRNPLPKTLWHKSTAKPLLEKDIDNNKHKKMKPLQQNRTRLEYCTFTLKEFRQHMYQEVDMREKKLHCFNKKKTRSRYPAGKNWLTPGYQENE
jgi:hypothetical protein